MASYAHVPDEEMGGLFDSKAGPSIEFAEREVRLGFVRKVFGLLSAQLAVTVAVTAAFLSSAGAQRFVASNPWTLWAALGASLGTLLLLSCSESARRSHPTNLFALGAFTVAQSLLVAVASAAYATATVLSAAGLALGITACLSLYATQTRRDFTAAGGVLFSLLFGLLGAGLLAALFPSRGAELALSGLGAALFGAYVVFDVQLLLGGGRGAALSPDEYVFAALSIYLDVINMFLYLLRLLQELQSNN